MQYQGTAVLEQVEVGLQLDTVLIDRLGVSNWSLSHAAYDLLARLVVRDAVVRGIVTALTAAQAFAPEQRGSDRIAPGEVAEFEGLDRDTPEWLADALLKQHDSFASIGVVLKSPVELTVPFDGGVVDVLLEPVAQESGSWWDRRRVRVSITKGLHGIAVGVLVFLITAGISVGSNKVDAVETKYVCTIGAEVTGSRESLTDDAMRDLEMPADASAEETRHVWASRQRCLAASGMNPGPIDGEYGPLTKGAEAQFESTYRVGVNWQSRAFRRFIIDRASTRVKTLNDASR